MNSYNFPKDYGSHQDFKIEWWHTVGWLSMPTSIKGFQASFFRFIEKSQQREYINAHIAFSDPQSGKLFQDQILAPESIRCFCKKSTTHVVVNDTSLMRLDTGDYQVKTKTSNFSYDLLLIPTQSKICYNMQELLAPSDEYHDSDFYYTEPQLRVTGSATLNGVTERCTGVAWLDHQWTNGQNALFSSSANGWDWIGLNMDDGSVIMCFKIRASDGSEISKALFERSSDGSERIVHDIEITEVRRWKSPVTSAEYPVEMVIKNKDDTFHIQPLYDDQELNAIGISYWEGAVRVLKNGKAIGRGYLEMNGYHKPVELL